MVLTQFFAGIAQFSRVLFVVTSMLTMGLSLTLAQIRQPLKNVRLVALALLANFVLVPLLAYAILRVIPLEEPLRDGLIVISTAAGAPVLPKLVQNAKGNLAYGVGLMVMLTVVSIIYLPIVLPRLLTGAQVNQWEMARSLIVLLLVPLAIGLFVNSRLPRISQLLGPLLNMISSVAFMFLVVVTAGLNISNMFNLVASGGILALLLFFIGSLLIGIVLGGRDPAIRSVMGLGTAARDVSAALVVVAQSFSGTSSLPFVVVAGVLGLLILLPVAKWFGVHSQVMVAPPADAAR